jgi:hypothetical protein
MSQPLNLWTLFDSPADAPGCFVVRRFEVFDFGARATLETFYSQRLETLRELMRSKGLYCIGRCEHDEPQIVETWL